MKEYVVYDARGRFDEDRAAVLSVEASLQDAKDIIEEMEWDACIFEYDSEGNMLVNGHLIE